jgi:signal transduction histidine kinase
LTEDRFAQARIMVVDDDLDVVRILERTLAEGGYADVAGFSDARTLAAAYQVKAPDLMLLDVLMPGPSRLSLLAWINEQPVGPPRPPILALGADGKARELALAGGAMDFLVMPVDRDEVLLRVRNLLARRFLELDLWKHGQLLEKRMSERTRELKESLDRLRETSRQRHELAMRLVTAQEEERRRIAAEVHDGSVQTLVALRLRLRTLADGEPGPDSRAQIERLERMASDALAQLRSLMAELTTPALALNGLAVGVQEYLASTRESGGPPVKFEASVRRELPAEARLMLFRIAQEALTNARKHAPAAALTVTLDEEREGVRLTVHDDGPGFDPDRPAQPGHLGLTLMKERATMAGGWSRIESAPGRGTTVSAWLPFAAVEGEPLE